MRIWLMIFSFIFSLIAFEEIVDDVFSDPLEGDYEAFNFDRVIGQWVSKYRSPGLNQMMIDLTSLGSVSVILVLFLILISLLIFNRDFKGIIYLTMVYSGAGLWPLYLKSYFGRVRPEVTGHLVNVSDLSFPSGHAFGATAAYIALVFYAAQYAKSTSHELFFYLLGVGIVSLVCVSRIYLGVHYPTDVLGGVTAGYCWVMLVSVVFKFSFFRSQVRIY